MNKFKDIQMANQYQIANLPTLLEKVNFGILFLSVYLRVQNHICFFKTKMTSVDKDFRFMATNDLMTELQNDSINAGSKVQANGIYNYEQAIL